jgi:translation initiation factor 2B subunit (eIF-2B alpha/beta/delta family)
LIIFYTRFKIRQWRERLRGEAREAAKSLVEGFKVMEREIREEISRLDKKPGLSKEEEKIYQKLKEILEKTRKTIGKEIEDIEKILRLK